MKIRLFTKASSIQEILEHFMDYEEQVGKFTGYAVGKGT